MNGATPIIRNLTQEEIHTIPIAWASAEGWNPGLTDHASFLAADPAGFWGLFLDDEPVACLSAVRYEPGFAFLGFYIVRPEYRGQRFGRMLWDYAIQSLQGRVIGLDGVLAQEANYTRCGFRRAYRSIRFEGKTRATGTTFPIDHGLRRIGLAELAAVEAYDAPLFPAARGAFLRAWLAQPGTEGFAVYEGTQLHGFGVIRPCLRGWKIGPLFADAPTTAARLFTQLTAGLPAGSTFYLDVPEANPAALALAQAHSLRRVFETVRMYKGPAPALPLHRIFGNTSFELG